jgi:UDP-glucose 4-epimerase
MSILVRGGAGYPTPDGTGIRDYIHFEDLAADHLAALDYLDKGRDFTALNFGYGRGSSVREVIRMVKDAAGVDFAIREAARVDGVLIEEQNKEVQRFYGQ